MECRHCGSQETVRNGTHAGAQRFHCRSCQRYFRDRPPKFSAETKARAIDMHLNNVGIRKIARFTAPATVLDWIRKAHDAMLAAGPAAQSADTTPDIIEMDEIYTFVQKNGNAPSSGPLTAAGKDGSWPIISPTRA